ncbi:MAG: hypothetical protein WA090_03480 [Candidatus Nanopelagicaceae bacterium]
MDSAPNTVDPSDGNTPKGGPSPIIAKWLTTWILISGLLYLKIPTAFTKIYAEDGAISLQDALGKSFPQDFLEPYAGYLDVIGRGAGRVVSIFPLQDAANAFFIFNTFMLTWIALTVYYASSEIVPNRIGRSVLSLSLVLLPIASFESLANTTNLHFFFMSACLPIFLKKSSMKYEAGLFAFFVLVATLSTPLMIFYFPLMAYLRWSSKSLKWFAKPSLIEFAWLTGMLLQVAFILTRAYGDRTTTGVHSVAKTGFLYLDRVVGSTFFPWWGNVSDNTPSIVPSIFSARIYLLLRAVVALVLLALFVLYILRATTKDSQTRFLSVSILLTGFFYWFVVGVLFNPEPRYAIFPSFGLLLVLFYIHSNGADIRNFKLRQRVIIILLFLTWVGSWSPSALRVNGPTWATEYEKAQATCLTGAREAQIPIIPTNLEWHVVIDCKKIR